MQKDDKTWRTRAACRGTDVSLWFPAPAARTASVLELRRVRDAKAICEGCPVQQECLDYALGHTIWHGVWGALTEQERRTLALRNRRARARAGEGQTA